MTLRFYHAASNRPASFENCLYVAALMPTIAIITAIDRKTSGRRISSTKFGAHEMSDDNGTSGQNLIQSDKVNQYKIHGNDHVIAMIPNVPSIA